MYFAHNHVSSGQQMRFSVPRESVITFAEESVRKLKDVLPGTHFSGLVRVDIMQRSNAMLVVNEFESLEAMYSSQDNDLDDCKTHSRLVEMWSAILIEA